MQRMVMTGAAGHIGSWVGPRLADVGWRVTGVDLKASNRGIVADFGDLAAMAPLLSDADALIHLGGVVDAEDWVGLETVNIVATRALLVAAAQAGVRKLVYASSIHAGGYAPFDACFDQRLIDAAPPDGPYGLSKRHGEALLGLLHRRHGVDSYALRIGTFRDRPFTRRECVTWLSPDDFLRLVLACLAPRPATSRTLWALSANSGARIDRSAWEAIGYRPVDDAEQFRDQVSDGLDVDGAGAGLIGGRFVRERSSPFRRASGPE